MAHLLSERLTLRSGVMLLLPNAFRTLYKLFSQILSIFPRYAQRAHSKGIRNMSVLAFK